MIRTEVPVNIPKAVMKRIGSLSGIELSQGADSNLVTMDVVNQEIWDQKIPDQLPVLGYMIPREYFGAKFSLKDGARDQAVRQLELTFKGATRLYMCCNTEEVIGLCCLEHYPEDPSIAIIRDMIVDRRYRGLGIGRQLYRELFRSERNLRAIVGYSKTPAAVNLRFEHASQLGHETSFGDMGNKGRFVCTLQDLMIEYMRSQGIVAAHRTPPGFISLKAEEEIFYPLKSDEVKFPRGHILYEIFQRLLKIQNRVEKDTVVGIMVTTLRK